MSGFKRWLLFVICLALVGLHAAFPGVKVDATSVWLVGIACVLLLLPELKTVLPYIKRLKVGDTEIELDQLSKEVEKAAESSERAGADLGEDANANVAEVLREAGQDPRAAFLLLASKLEDQVTRRLEEQGLVDARRFMTAPRAVERGVEAGLFDPSFLSAFQDFWAIRNSVAHGRAFDVPDATIYSLISIGTNLLKAVSARPVASSVTAKQKAG